MSLKKLLSTPVEDQEVIVAYKDMTFVVRGRPDATIMQNCLFLQPDKKASFHKAIETTLKWKFPEEMLANMLMIQHTLVNDEAKDKEDARYDLIEIAAIGKDHGPLYLQLLNAALTVLGLADMNSEEDRIAEIAAKN